MPSSCCCPISIVFINGSAEKYDDTVVIRRTDDYTSYNVTYIERGDRKKPIKNKLYYISRKQVEDYVYSLLKNVSLDEEPCINVQVNVPVMPRVLFSVKSLQDDYVRRHVTDMICENLEYLDYMENPDEEEDEMPALAPLHSSQYSYNYPPTPPTRATAPGVLPQRLFWD